MALVYLFSFSPESIPERLRKCSEVASRNFCSHNENTSEYAIIHESASK